MRHRARGIAQSGELARQQGVERTAGQRHGGRLAGTGCALGRDQSVENPHGSMIPRQKKTCRVAPLCRNRVNRRLSLPQIRWCMRLVHVAFSSLRRVHLV
ncbi:hypothetical protein WR25_10709 [Diploscapter pachys]|uniref:Uncharacterized protein n=1 Tax=Diploscapter pachys TaxID=2018661 RepID=A0A2A2JY45_9BILA|nr:hypothetical protein WR25_10709 [Diploscapter pachys]